MKPTQTFSNQNHSSNNKKTKRMNAVRAPSRMIIITLITIIIITVSAYSSSAVANALTLSKSKHLVATSIMRRRNEAAERASSLHKHQQSIIKHHEDVSSDSSVAPGNVSYEGIVIHTVDSRALFVAEIEIGTPPQVFWMTLDTGSSTTWVTSFECDSSICKSHSRYNSSLSSSYVPVDIPLSGFTITYGSGEIEGYLAQDNIVFAGYTLSQQIFGLVYDENGKTFNSDSWSGLIGLGFPQANIFTGSISTANLTLIDAIAEYYDLEVKAFSFWLSYETQESYFFIGGPRSGFYEGELLWIDVKDEFYWSANLDDILVDGESIGLCPNNNCTAIFDSGTTYNSAPTKDLATLLTAVAGTTKAFRCDNKKYHKTISYVFNGKRFDLEPEDYLASSKDGKYCSPEYFASDIDEPYGPAYILGELFMLKYYTVFDRENSRIGIALAASSDKVTELLASSVHETRRDRKNKGSKQSSMSV